MITMSFRLRRGRILAFALVGAMVLGGGLFLRSTMMGAALSSGAARPKKISTTAKSEEDRMAFIAVFGWDVKNEPEEIRDVMVPREFDEIFEKYNFLQKQQNFDLSKLKGKTCRRYTYTITNYPGGIENVRLNMLVYKNKIVGGDVTTASLDGFMHGFDIASAATWLSTPESQSAQTEVKTPMLEEKVTQAGAYPRD